MSRAQTFIFPQRATNGSYILYQPTGTFIFKTLQEYLSFQKTNPPITFDEWQQQRNSA